MGPWVMGLSPVLGSALSTGSAWVSLSFSLCSFSPYPCSLSKINKSFFKKRKRRKDDMNSNLTTA